MKIVALVGFAGSGKDTAGQFLVENHGFKAFSFAESLKDTVASIFCWNREMLEGKTNESRVWREQVDHWWSEKLGIPNFTPRFALQNIGTNVFRQHFHNDIWINNVERKITLLPQDTNIVISDGRFPNELALARQFGGKVVRVKRGPEPEWFGVARAANGYLPYGEDISARRETMQSVYKVHESEWAWIGSPIDETIENDLDIESLHSEVLRVCL